MTSENVKQYLFARPFEPFRVLLSSGDSVEVADPENAKLVKGGLYVFYRSNPAEEFPDRWRNCSFLHIAAIDGVTRPE